ncbi:uncharacterized protein LOC141692125 [Apium graveolens]|uniref:uncharacterized protein LOC141692125 n=1 Tax=Apium graveolens TaxID=4045 RepID=UPI003D79D585
MISWIRACICTPRFSVKINGIVHGYFKGSVGVRQGDPVSPYIFSLCMNILSSLLAKVPMHYKFHWRCKEMGITHLFFADDVLFFANGSRDSLLHIMRNLAIFSDWSGLKPSIHKSTSFLSNCAPNFCQWITGKLNSWANLLLSLVGRAMLIKSIIHAVQSFWSNHFLLPTAVHYNIQSLLTKFLWKGNIYHKGGAKVAWNSVCLPKAERGLGFKDMVQWNQAQIIHHLIRVVIKSRTLWATWVNKIVLKNKHFWILEIPTDCSWIWKKVLRLRYKALQFISYHIVEGDSISLWFEPWWHNCCLAKSNSSPIISQCMLTANATVASIISSGTWCLPNINPRTHHRDPVLDTWMEGRHFPQISSRGRDHILWDGFDCAKIKTWHIWNSIRNHGVTPVWHKAVWNKICIQRYTHHQWLTCWGRLSTLSRLNRFGIITTQQCYLCILGRETTTHLFMHCSYSRWVLNRLFSTLDISVSCDTWVNFLVSLTAMEDQERGTLALCFAQVYCYHIWRERNARAHGKGVFGPYKLLKGIIVDIKARLISSK